VVLNAWIVRKLEALYDEIVAAGGPQPAILPLDFSVAKSDDFNTVAGAVRTQLGRLDALVHTAASLGSLGPVEHQSLKRWHEAFRVDVAPALGLIRGTMPLLAASPDASVVLTLDTRGQAPRAYWGGHAVAKASLMAFAAVLADEWETRPSLRINAVVPGPMNSPMRMLTHPGEEKTHLPRPEALVPLYLHLIAGQTKGESGACIDGAAWLAGHPGSFPLRGATWGPPTDA
jgi:NAD(P)-dependent dehydrogenase (short-subunit alcohol dehydrogenase family)